MAELNHFRTFEIAQTETGAPLELARDGERVGCLGFDTVRRRFVEIYALGEGDGEQFIERAAAVASQPHRALAPIVDFGNEAGVFYFATDLVDGESLEAYAGRVNAVPPEAALAWLRQIAEGAAVLAGEGLSGGIDKARLTLGEFGIVAARIADFGFVDNGAMPAPIGSGLASCLRALTNYQGTGEEPVYPPEVAPLCAELEGVTDAARCAELLVARGAGATAPPIGESKRPRLLLEREMFRRAGPEHVLPERYRPVRRAGEISPYESIVIDGEGGARLRVLVLPPERFVSENLLDIFEHPGCDEALKVASFWNHHDFRLLAEEMRAGFSLGDWMAAVPLRPGSEIVDLLDATGAALGHLSESGVRPRELHPDDVLLEFDGIDEAEVGALLRDGSGARWPEYSIKVHTHPTLRTLTNVGDGAIPDGAEEVLEAAKRGKRLPAAEVFAWYFNLRNRGLGYQAGELVKSLRDVSQLTASETAQPSAPAPQHPEQGQPLQDKDEAQEEDEEWDDEDEDYEDLEEPVFSPIAAAMGIYQDDDEDEDELEGQDIANPIARQVVLGHAPEPEEEEPNGEEEEPQEEPPQGEGEPETDDEADATPFSAAVFAAAPVETPDLEDLLEEGAHPKPRGGGANLLLLLFILVTAIAIAAAVAHLTGRAFWLER